MHDVWLSIVLYALFSSLMLVINKMVFNFIPLPACVFAVQFATTLFIMIALQAFGVIRVDQLCFNRAKQFVPYVSSFVMSIYCSGKVLQYSNVETLITFRSCTPLCVSVLDWLFLGRELPARRSLIALVGVVCGACGYVLSDREFELHGLGAYGWVFIYLSGNVFEMTYGKYVLSRMAFESPIWGAVLYTNALALPPMVLVAFASGETARLESLDLGFRESGALAICCVTGVGISWSGWNCREKTAATTYTLLGVACKMISVLIIVFLWEKHASPTGIAWLGICLFSSSVYQQAPLRVQWVADDSAQLGLDGVSGDISPASGSLATDLSPQHCVGGITAIGKRRSDDEWSHRLRNTANTRQTPLLELAAERGPTTSDV